MLLSEQFGFLRNWIADPRRTGALSPSSHSLADIITGEITGSDAPIIELGPGTGVFTRCLIQRGVREDQLALVESGVAFAQLLSRRFPAAQVLCMNACELDRVHLFDGQLAGTIVSGLPLLSMSIRTIVTLLRSSFSHLRPKGAFYQFTYGPRCPVPRAVLERCGLRARRIGGTLANVPPAAVYKISRRTPTIRV